MKEYAIIGTRVPRVDARVKATGQAVYTGDIVLPRALCGKLLRSPYPHAKILRIDTSQAERLPGVKAVITGQDIGKKYYLPSVMMEAEPKLDTIPLAVDKVRHIGEAVAAVAAVDESVAAEALKLIKVDYEKLPAVFDFLEAMKDGAPQLHDHSKNNIMTEIHWTYGDIEKGFRESDYIREDTFYVAGHHSLALETQIAISRFDATGKLTCWTSTQVPHLVQRELSRLLGITMGNIRVIKPTTGGSFCQKLDIEPHQILSAMLAIKTGFPVKIELPKEEVFLACAGNSPAVLTFKTGVKKDGTIVSRYVNHVVESGGYQLVAPSNLYHGGICLQQVYRQSYLKYDGYCVYTNTPPRGTERGGRRAERSPYLRNSARYDRG